MTTQDAVTDPTDWAGTAAADLQPVDSALRCQVCKEFYKTPMITSCAHTFCSLCIRRCLTNEGKCPICRASDQTTRLRTNWAVEEIVNAFTAARPNLLELGRREDLSNAQISSSSSPPPRNLKRKLKDLSVESNGPTHSGLDRRKTRSQSQRNTESNSPIELDVNDSEGEDDIDDSVEHVQDGKVQCPICSLRMKEEEVSPHIDKAHMQPVVSTAPKAAYSLLGAKRGSALNGTAGHDHTPERLSHLNYSLLSDTALRKKLTSLGIPTNGNKQQMTRRHKEWVDLYNANCDSSTPRSKRELLSDLTTWEKTQGFGRGNDDTDRIMSKDFDGAAWAHKNDSDFKDLIAKARVKKQPPPSSSTESQQAASSSIPEPNGSSSVPEESTNIANG